MKLAVAAMAAVLVLTMPAYALDPIPGESPREKARNDWKRARDRDTDEKYQESLKQIPEAQKKSNDPWAGVRAPDNSSAPKR